MSIFKFVSQAHLDDLDEDPRIAFMELVNHAQRSLEDQTKDLSPDEHNQWQVIEDIRLRFVNVVLASAKRYEIEPFYSMEVPRISDFKDSTYRQFQYDLDYYVTQLVLDNSLRTQRSSVAVQPKTLDKIRAYTTSLRQCVEEANLTDVKRNALLSKIDDFLAELEKRRLSMFAVAKIAFEILAIPGGCWASVDVANKLITNVMQTVAEAKALEIETQQITASEPLKALAPPRREVPISATRKPAYGAGDFADDLDDDVPF